MKIKCLLLDTDLSSVNLLSNHLKQNNIFELDHIFSNVIEAKEFLNSKTIDIIFIDVELGLINAFEFMDSLKQKPEVVFISSSEEFAYQAIENDAIDFMLKPLNKARLNTCLDKCLRRLNYLLEEQDKEEVKTIKVKHKHKTIKIAVNKIAYIKAFGDYLKIYTTNFDSFIILSTMKDMEKLLPANLFYRAQKSYIVNIEKITKINSRSLFINDYEISISRKITKTLREYFNKLD